MVGEGRWQGGYREEKVGNGKRKNECTVMYRTLTELMHIAV